MAERCACTDWRQISCPEADCGETDVWECVSCTYTDGCDSCGWPFPEGEDPDAAD